MTSFRWENVGHYLCTECGGCFFDPPLHEGEPPICITCGTGRYGKWFGQPPQRIEMSSSSDELPHQQV